LDFYLSEMSVSDLHGGGLTLQRVLAEELDGIPLFVHVCRFGTDYPVAKRFAPNCVDIPLWPESDKVRHAIGRRAAAWLTRRHPIMQSHAKQVAQTILAKVPESDRPLRALVCPQGPHSLYAIEALGRLRPLEYVSWVMDDHLVRWHNDNWHYPADFEEMLRKHLKRARTVFVISPSMGEFFRERFGVESEVLFGSADLSAEPRWDVPQSDGHIRLGYFGALGPWQLDALVLLADGLAAANASLEIYTGNSALPEALQRPQVKLQGRIPPAQVPSTMRTYDAVVLPASFEPHMRNMTGLNIATKMSESLASGTVTFLIGPPYGAMTRYLEEAGAAVLVSNRDPGSVATAVASIRDMAFRKNILQSAQQLVESNLSSAAMRKIWHRGLARLSQPESA